MVKSVFHARGGRRRRTQCARKFA
uniref:Uncharacterized protein n=1 Tax=Rhizophora mucronata TaxID=61149 RepID=A0A2P2KER9_RHIMU